LTLFIQLGGGRAKRPNPPLRYAQRPSLYSFSRCAPLRLAVAVFISGPVLWLGMSSYARVYECATFDKVIHLPPYPLCGKRVMRGRASFSLLCGHAAYTR